MRAAGAEVGDAGGGLRALGAVALDALELGHLVLDVVPRTATDQPLAQLDGNVGGIERVLGREQPLLVLVLLAEHTRPVGQVVELLLDLALDQRALLLHHQDHVEPLRELQEPLRLQWPGHADFVEPQAQPVGRHLVDAQLVHGRPHVEVALARRDNADLGGRSTAGDDAVEAVRAGEGEDSRALVLVEPCLLGEGLVAEADVEAARRRREVLRDLDLDAIDTAVDRGGRLDVVLDALEAHPHAGIARQGEAENAVVEDLLHARRVQDRDHVVDERELRLVRAGRALAGVVVAHQREHPAVPRGAGVVGVTEHVASTVHARAFAVPDAEYAVILALAPELGLLRAPQGGSRQVLVEARLELDAVGLQDAVSAQHRRFQRGDGRAAVAGHVTRRVEPRPHVAGALGQHQANDGLGAGQELAGLVKRIFVVETDGVLGHLDPGVCIFRAAPG